MCVVFRLSGHCFLNHLSSIIACAEPGRKTAVYTTVTLHSAYRVMAHYELSITGGPFSYLTSTPGTLLVEQFRFEYHYQRFERGLGGNNITTTRHVNATFQTRTEDELDSALVTLQNHQRTREVWDLRMVVIVGTTDRTHFRQYQTCDVERLSAASGTDDEEL